MHIHFSNCNTSIEILYFILSGLSVLIAIISGMMVFSNEKELEGKDALLNAILGPLNIFLTDKSLNKTGKKWRFFFIGSVLSIIISMILGLYFQPCSADIFIAR